MWFNLYIRRDLWFFCGELIEGIKGGIGRLVRSYGGRLVGDG